MKYLLSLSLSLVSFNVFAIYYTSDLISITGLDRGDVIKALYRAIPNKPHMILSHTVREELNEHDIMFIKEHLNWKVDDINNCYLGIDLSEDVFDARTYNALNGGGKNLAKKVIDELREEKGVYAL